MDVPARVVHPLLILAVVLAGVLGYLAGSHHGSSGAARGDLGGKARLASSSGLLLEYPLGWEQAPAAQTIPGLPLGSSIMLRPQGSSSTGLVSGLLPAGEAAPLPAVFLTHLQQAPHAEIVDLVSTQAYRFSNLKLPGYASALDVYVIPNGSGAPRAMACFATASLTPAEQQCERIVSSVTLAGVSAPALAPEPSYAGSLTSVLAALQSARTGARAQMSHSSSAGAVAGPASALSARYAAAAKAVGNLEAPAVASSAQTRLVAALRRASAAYSSLAEAARTESLGEYDSDRGQVSSAESGVDTALETFTLLGYGAS